MRNIKKVLIFFSIVAVCIGVYSGITSIVQLYFEGEEIISIHTCIKEYKIAEDEIELFADDRKNNFYVDIINIPLFKKEIFKETYSKGNEYVVIVKKSDYDRYKIGKKCPLYGVLKGKQVFLDVKKVQEIQNMNALLGLVVSVGMFASAIYLLYVIKSGKYKELE